MFSVCLKLATVLCLSCTALSDPESNRVVWKKTGQAITVQCRTENPVQSLTLTKGVVEKVEVIHMVQRSQKTQIAEEFRERLQFHGNFPNVDILIKNLTSDDTGPYLCQYKWFDGMNMKQVEGNGSVLLVVTEETKTVCAEATQNSNENLVLVSVVISAAVLLGLITGALIWLFIKTKTTAVKPRHVPNNDVYEDMRGTLRR